jgi:DNA-binding response OmpR family regulator
MMMNLLLVEDDERVRRFVHRGLESEGYCVTLAADGKDGLERAMNEDYDVLLLDVMLPHLGGDELCRRLRQSGSTTPIMMLTAVDHTEAKVQSLRGGADDYMTKPFDFEELLARIEVLGRRGRNLSGAESGVSKLGDLRVDLEAKTVFMAGDEVHLTALEYRLLELFLQSPARCSAAPGSSTRSGATIPIR